MNSKEQRYLAVDDVGSVRKFFTKSEALSWIKARPELRLETLPKKPKPNIFETSEEAVF